MPIQVYKCREHGEFEIRTSFDETVPAERLCPICRQYGSWVPQVVAIRVK